MNSIIAHPECPSVKERNLHDYSEDGWCKRCEHNVWDCWCKE